MLVLIPCMQKWGGPFSTLTVFLTSYSLSVPLCLLYHIWVHCRIINNPVITPPFSLFSAQKRQGQKINLILCTLSLLTFYLRYLCCRNICPHIIYWITLFFRLWTISSAFSISLQFIAYALPSK